MHARAADTEWAQARRANQDPSGGFYHLSYGGGLVRELCEIRAPCHGCYARGIDIIGHSKWHPGQGKIESPHHLRRYGNRLFLVSQPEPALDRSEYECVGRSPDFTSPEVKSPLRYAERISTRSRKSFSMVVIRLRKQRARCEQPTARHHSIGVKSGPTFACRWG
jgi:hypothetical protein